MQLVFSDGPNHVVFGRRFVQPRLRVYHQTPLQRIQIQVQESLLRLQYLFLSTRFNACPIKDRSRWAKMRQRQASLKTPAGVQAPDNTN